VARASGRLAVCAALAVATTAAAPDRDPGRLRPGLFLYAAPEQQDPNFVESVVLLVEHGPKGSMGLVVNRPTRVPLRELLRGVEIPASPDLRFYWGGPVEPKAVLALVRTERPSASARSVLPDVYVTGELADVRAALKEKKPGERLRVFTGYAGWGAGQLAMEVRAGAWVLDRADARSIFAPDISELWLRVHRLLERLEARGSLAPEPCAFLEVHRGREVEAARKQAVVLRVAELALGHRIAAVGQVSPTQAHLEASTPVADEGRERGVCVREGGVALVEVATAHVAKLGRGEDAARRRPG